LGGLVGTQSNYDVELNEESTSQSNITQNHASCQSLIDIKSEEEEGSIFKLDFVKDKVFI